ncbi:MAG: hypothetical protein J1G06_09860 [Oscillospiraceae bacterium]|nr:hypothetical protein [Oscillospiraceae bacterium]
MPRWGINVKYLSQINALMSWQFNNGILPDGEYRLYMTLLHCMNQQHWEEHAAIPNGTVKFLSNINNDTKLKRYRDGLISKGLIQYKMKMYMIPKLYRDENVSEASAGQTEKRKENVSNSVSLLLDKDKDTDKDADKDKCKGTTAQATAKKTINDVLKTVTDSRVLSALKGFIAHRKSMNKPLTAYALENSIELLQRLGGDDADTMCKIVEQSILRNWQSFYELKTDHRNVNQNVSQTESSHMSSTEGISEIEKQFMSAYG